MCDGQCASLHSYWRFWCHHRRSIWSTEPATSWQPLQAVWPTHHHAEHRLLLREHQHYWAGQHQQHGENEKHIYWNHWMLSGDLAAVFKNLGDDMFRVPSLRLQGLFGNTAATQSGGLFGTSQTSTATGFGAATGLFGQTNAGFGNVGTQVSFHCFNIAVQNFKDLTVTERSLRSSSPHT